MKKNDIIQIEITGLTAEGNGVGRHNGIVVFVPMTAVGDVIECRIVKLAKSYAYGIVERIIRPSDDRVDPACPTYSKCGGCVFRHMTYQAELKAKEGFVYDSFRRIGGFDLMPEPIQGCKAFDHYRNKSQLPVASSADGRLCYGFFSPRSHRVVPFNSCMIQPDIFCKISDYVVDYCGKNGISAYNEELDSGLLRHIYLRTGAHSGEIMLTLVVTANTNAFGAMIAGITKRFPDIKTVTLNINPDKTNVILGRKDKTLYGLGTISDTMCGLKVEISPHSFYQVNTPAAEAVYAVAKEYAGLTGKETLLDLYCGIGTVGLSMADKVKKLMGVEVVPEAIDNAKANALANGITNAEFICGDAGQIAQELSEKGETIDVIVVDPPRKGCDDKTLNAILKMSPAKLVYISCNHSTAARDAKYLCENGYSLVKYRPCDMFPRTGHVETVCLLSKLNTK